MQKYDEFSWKIFFRVESLHNSCLFICMNQRDHVYIGAPERLYVRLSARHPSRVCIADMMTP